jgi:hypothetical protein
MGYPAHDADEVPCAVLESHNNRPETILALAQLYALTFQSHAVPFQLLVNLSVAFDSKAQSRN